MATLTVAETALAGTTVTLVAAAGGGDDFANDGKTIFIVDNADASATTVTFNDTGSVAPESATSFDPDVAESVTNGDRDYFGPFPTTRFGTSVGVTYSKVTSLTVAAVRVP